jgi:uncharacterized membrane protein SpoIIM required for sporulation
LKVVELLEKRRDNWRQLEQLCVQMESRARRRMPGATVVQFASLYRAACADLALADAYQLPAGTVTYLHQLVARAHNQLYRSRQFEWRKWGHELFHNVPRRLYRDRYLWLAMIIFWGIFAASFVYARNSRKFAETLVGKSQLENYQDMYAKPLDRRNAHEASAMAGLYIYHNTSIALQCFALGLFFGVGGLVELVFNAAQMGAVFGFMTNLSEWPVFSNFVTAHGPFELTAIVLAAAAGMRLGFAMIDTRGMSRLAALRQAGREAMPAMGAAMVMLFMAALIEGFLSPSPLPYAIKAAVAIVSSILLLFYVLVLGSRGLPDPIAAPQEANLHAT